MYGYGRGQQSQELQEEAKVEIIEPRGGRPYVEIGRIPGNDKVKVTFKLKFNGITGTECTVKYTSTRGGVVSKKTKIGD